MPEGLLPRHTDPHWTLFDCFDQNRTSLCRHKFGTWQDLCHRRQGGIAFAFPLRSFLSFQSSRLQHNVSNISARRPPVLLPHFRISFGYIGSRLTPPAISFVFLASFSSHLYEFSYTPLRPGISGSTFGLPHGTCTDCYAAQVSIIKCLR